jgi:hypothetical protein
MEFSGQLHHWSLTLLGKRRLGGLRLKCDDTREETRFRLSAKRTSPFKSAGASVQSTAGSRGVRISGSNAGCTMFRGSVKGTGYPLHSPFSTLLPLPCVTVCQSHFNWTPPVRMFWKRVTISYAFRDPNHDFTVQPVG